MSDRAVQVWKIPDRVWASLSDRDQRFSLLLDDAGKGRLTEDEFTTRLALLDLEALRAVLPANPAPKRPSPAKRS